MDDLEPNPRMTDTLECTLGTEDRVVISSCTVTFAGIEKSMRPEGSGIDGLKCERFRNARVLIPKIV